MTVKPPETLAARGLGAAALWVKADPALVSSAYEKIGFSMPAKGKWKDDERQLVADWIAALAWSNPAKASAKLSEWRAADPQSPDSYWAVTRIILEAPLSFAGGEAAKTKTAIAEIKRALDAARARLDAKVRAAPKKRRTAADEEENIRILAVRQTLRRAEFLMATHDKGEAAFADFADADVNPFVDGSGTLYRPNDDLTHFMVSGLEII